MASGFDMLFQNLESVGFFEVFLPIVLFLAIYFGILKKTEVVGDDDAVIGVASIALSFITVFGLLAVVPASFFPQFFGLLATLIVSILAIVIMAGLSGMNIGDEDQKWLRYGVFLLGVSVIVFALPSVFGGLFNTEMSGVFMSEEVRTFVLTLVLIGVLGGVIYALSNGE